MNRRSFLSLFGVTTAALAMDPERLLWEPGKKLISIPSVITPTGWSDPVSFGVGDIVTFAGKYAINPRTRKETDKLQMYVVSAVGDSDGVIAKLSHYCPPSKSRVPLLHLTN